jgi:hypothetical protein
VPTTRLAPISIDRWHAVVLRIGKVVGFQSASAITKECFLYNKKEGSDFPGLIKTRSCEGE